MLIYSIMRIVAWKKEISGVELKRGECKRKRFRAQVKEGASLTKADHAILHNREQSFGYREHNSWQEAETLTLPLTYKKS